MEILRLLTSYQYADVRVESGRELNIRIMNNETSVTAGTYRLMSARVLVGSSWGFASSNNPSIDAEELLKRAAALAKTRRGKVRLGRSTAEKRTIKHRVKAIADEEKINELRDAAKVIGGRYICGKIISYRDWSVEKSFYSSEGAEIKEQSEHAYLGCTAIAKKGSVIEQGYERDASIAGFDKIDAHTTATNALKKAEKTIIAKPSPKGRFTIILDPNMTGVFCHEAVGHACEADSVLERESILAGKLGRRIASPLVNIVDDPTYKEFGFYVYDDEGVKAKRVELVRNGVLVAYLNSRETAEKLSMALNGHARSEGADCIPIVRMSNTFMLRGTSSLNDIFDIKYGIYVKGVAGGSVDTFSGGFMFKAQEAYEIVNGEKKQSLRGMSISGNILETLKNIEMVGRDFGTSPGMCGKLGQEVPVSDGGPHIRVSNMMVG